MPARPTPLFADIADVAAAGPDGYLPDTATATAVFLDRLSKPSPRGRPHAGSARPAGARRGAGHWIGLVRLQCYEGVDEARALYEWNQQADPAYPGRLGDWGHQNRCVIQRFPCCGVAADLSGTEPTV